jgi:DNA-binding IclR family transcriptional regulator
MIFEGGPLHAALPFGYSIEAPSAESRQCNPEAYALSELSISRSVGRAFEVLEYFRNARAPCSTPELEKALNVPYSSVRAILKSLKTLGYLEFHAERKTYFPTEKLMNLGNWVHGAMFESEPLTQLLHSVHRRLDETIAIATPNFIFCNLIGVRNGSRPQSLQVPGGIGLTLAQSTAGRVLLSQMSDTQIERLVQHTRYWAATTRSPMASDLAEVMPRIMAASKPASGRWRTASPRHPRIRRWRCWCPVHRCASSAMKHEYGAPWNCIYAVTAPSCRAARRRCAEAPPADPGGRR